MTQTTPTRDEAVPTGWKLVPIEPTPEMMDAAIAVVEKPCFPQDIYAAMLASAPASGGVDAVAVPKWVYTSALARFDGDTNKVRCYHGSIHAGWEDTPEFETSEAFYAWAKAECDRRNAYLASLSPAATPVSEAGGFLRELANRLRNVPCEHIDGGDIDRLLEIAGQEPTQREKEAAWSAFHEWWYREQACPEHSMTTQNAAHAAWQEAYRLYALAKPASSPAGGDVVAELEAERRRFDYVRIQRDAFAAELQNRVSAEHEVLMAEALAEIKATVDGESDQPVRDIVYGLLAEIEALPKRTLSQSTSGGRVGE